jgi:hypothetical protein
MQVFEPVYINPVANTYEYIDGPDYDYVITNPNAHMDHNQRAYARHEAPREMRLVKPRPNEQQCGEHTDPCPTRRTLLVHRYRIRTACVHQRLRGDYGTRASASL